MRTAVYWLTQKLVIILILDWFQDDENDVLAELDQLIGADLEPTIGSELPSVPDTQPETIEDKLPEVPTQVLHCDRDQRLQQIIFYLCRSQSPKRRSRCQLQRVEL